VNSRTLSNGDVIEEAAVPIFYPAALDVTTATPIESPARRDQQWDRYHHEIRTGIPDPGHIPQCDDWEAGRHISDHSAATERPNVFTGKSGTAEFDQQRI
jgi:hypothetical protein